jgi:ABC-type glutathione transport system ATPase component
MSEVTSSTTAVASLAAASASAGTATGGAAPVGTASVDAAGRPADSGAIAAADPLVQVEGVRMHFRVGSHIAAALRGNAALVKAIDGVDFTLQRGESVGLLGESGCGRTTMGRLLLRLLEPTDGRSVFMRGSKLPVARLFSAQLGKRGPTFIEAIWRGFRLLAPSSHANQLQNR